MVKTLSNPFIRIFPVPVLFLILYLLADIAITHPDKELIFVGISLDLLIVVPFVYFLLIRTTEIPKFTMLPVIIGGLVVGLFIIPPANQQILQFFRNYLLPLIELAVVFVVILKVRRVRGNYLHKRKELDFFSSLAKACGEVLPGVAANVLAMEIAVIYYAIFRWGSRSYNNEEFTNYKNSNIRLLLVVISFLTLAETFIFHLVLVRWSEIAAWILTGLSLYTFFQILGILKSIPDRPVILTQDFLKLRYGIVAEANIPLNSIVSIEKIQGSVPNMNEFSNCSLLGELEEYNLAVILDTETELTSLYGRKKQVRKLLFYVDEPDRLISRLGRPAE